MKPMTAQQEFQRLSAVHDVNITGAKGFIEDGSNKDGAGNFVPSNIGDIVRDAKLVGAPNTTVPVSLLSYWDPKAIEVLTAPLTATQVYRQVKKGNFASQQVHFRMQELTGGSEPYSDFANDGTADMNYNWPFRDVYRFQTSIMMGDLETEKSGEAKISLVADKQRAAASIIAIDANKFFIYGVKNMQIFGLLNDPNLLPAEAPLDVDGKTEWVDKGAVDRYNDVLFLFEALVEQMQGHVDANTALTLTLSPALSVQLGGTTQYGNTVLDMLKKYFSNLRLVVMPEMQASDGTQTMQLKADSVLGQVTGECLSPEKFRTYPVFRKESSSTQKCAAATSGSVLYRPAAVATMTGM